MINVRSRIFFVPSCLILMHTMVPAALMAARDGGGAAMITVLITENEQKVMALLSRVFKEEGFAVSDSLEYKGLELDDAFFNEKKGFLYKEIVGTIEKRLIEQVLRRTEGNQFKAARILGINRNTIRSKIKKLEIDAKKWKEQ